VDHEQLLAVLKRDVEIVQYGDHRAIVREEIAGDFEQVQLIVYVEARSRT